MIESWLQGRPEGRARRGRAAEPADHVLHIDSDHFGHCDDGQMLICHLLGQAFMEVEGQ